MKKKYLILGGVVLLALAIFVAFKFFKKSDFEYKTAQIKQGNLILKVLTTGTVQPENRLQIIPPVAGRAERILVKEGQKVQRGQTLAWISSSERAVMIDSARAVGPEEVKKWEEIYKPTPIIAPLQGTIILRKLEPGQTFSTNDVAFVMADRLVVSAQVDETDLAQIYLKQKANIELDAYPDQNFEAEVSQLAYEAKTVNNVTTYGIQVLPLQKIDFLRSGMTANVTFLGQEKKDILLIPNEYIRYVSGQPKTLLQVEKNRQEVDLEIGLTDGKFTEVKKGLALGDTVVLEIKKDTKAKNNLFSGPQRRNNSQRR